jgi:hypothetical protein|nr:MAG TPA: ParB protein [Caudoviricetes sp.]DAV15678.1 MAG TPA: ParB protein [Caudoviricetes sp.]
MNIEHVKLSQIHINANNPRTITDRKFNKLIDSILVLPKMLELRPIVVNETYTALGGNMRFRALTAIEEMSVEEWKKRLLKTRSYTKKTQGEQDNLISYWEAWKDNPTAPIVNASELSEDERREFIAKDNVGFGDWDMDMLANEWENEDLDEWGVDMPIFNTDGDINPDDCTDEFSLPDGEKGNVETVSFILSSKQATFIKEQLKISQYDDADTFGNTNKNGNALYSIVKQWADARI